MVYDASDRVPQCLFKSLFRFKIHACYIRKKSKYKKYGDLLSPIHNNILLRNKVTKPMQHIRGYLKPHVDYTLHSGTSDNGGISLKI